MSQFRTCIFRLHHCRTFALFIRGGGGKKCIKVDFLIYNANRLYILPYPNWAENCYFQMKTNGTVGK